MLSLAGNKSVRYLVKPLSWPQSQLKLQFYCAPLEHSKETSLALEAISSASGRHPLIRQQDVSSLSLSHSLVAPPFGPFSLSL